MKKRWTNEEISILNNYYPKYGVKYIFDNKLLIDRSEASIRTKVSELKLAVSCFWTENEDNIIREFYCKGVDFILNQNLLPNRNKMSIQKRGSDLKIKSGFEAKLKRYDISEYTNVRLPEVAYLLGYIWADGYCEKQGREVRMTFSKKDYENISYMFDFPLKWRRYEYPSKPGMIACNITSIDLNNLLKTLDYDTKSGSSACKVLKYISEDLRHYWWRGYFDGDGHLQLQGEHLHPRLFITSCYQQNWEFYEDLCIQLGIEYKAAQKDWTDMTIKGKQTRGRSSRIYVCNTKDCRKFLDYIYQGKIFGLKRKYDKYLILRDNVEIPSEHTSKYLGVHYRKDTKRFQAAITVNKKKISLGCYKSELNAALARDKFVKENNIETELNFK